MINLNNVHECRLAGSPRKLRHIGSISTLLFADLTETPPRVVSGRFAVTNSSLPPDAPADCDENDSRKLPLGPMLPKLRPVTQSGR